VFLGAFRGVKARERRKLTLGLKSEFLPWELALGYGMIGMYPKLPLVGKLQIESKSFVEHMKF
jgi:hypothetical protein